MSSSIWFAIDPKGNIFSLEHSANSKYLDKGSVLGSLFIRYSSYILLGVISSNTLPIKKQKEKKNKTGIWEDLALTLLYCHSFSLDIKSFSSLFFS